MASLSDSKAEFKKTKTQANVNKLQKKLQI